MKLKCLSRRQSGAYGFRIDVPKDLRALLGRSGYEFTLGYDEATAAHKAVELRNKYKRIFYDLRQKSSHRATPSAGIQLLADHGLPARKLMDEEALILPASFETLLDQYESTEDLPEPLREATNILKGIQTIRLKDVCDRYIQEKGKKDIQFPIDQFIDLVGNVDITHIRREHAYQYRAWLKDRGNSAGTQRKRLGAMSRLLNFARAEYDLPYLTNPFTKIRLDSEVEVKVRYPFTNTEHDNLINLCIDKGDDRRVALAVIAITGARLSEITGLLKKDVHLKLQAIDIYENTDRSLKTKNSRRSVPIVDSRVFALLKKFHKSAKEDNDPIFPSVYGKAKANTTSATLIKFIRTHINKDRMIHELRHTVATRLKRVLTPDQVMSEILGWKQGGMIGNYAGELELETKRKWLTLALKG